MFTLIQILFGSDAAVDISCFFSSHSCMFIHLLFESVRFCFSVHSSGLQRPFFLQFTICRLTHFLAVGVS